MNGNTNRWLKLAVLSVLGIGLTVGGVGVAVATGLHAPKPNTYAKSGTIIYSDQQFPDTLNILQTGLGVTFDTMNSVLASLAIFDSKARLYPDLLANIPSAKNHEVLNGGRTIILKLKPHQYWSSGVEITAADIKFGWQIDMDKATGPYCTQTCDHIASIQLKGKYEAILHLKDNFAPILYTGLPQVWPHSWSRLGKTPHDAAVTLEDPKFSFENNTYWTDGPYQVSSFVSNDRIVLTPMKYYHVHPGPHAAQMRFAFYADKDSLIAAAVNGNVDVSHGLAYTLADLPALKSHSTRFKVLSSPSFVAEHLEFNALDTTYKGHTNPLHDVRVRQALALDTDKISVLESALGVSAKVAKNYVAYTPWTVTPKLVQEFGDTALKGSWDPYAKKFLPYSPQTVADAKKLLAAAGYPKGFDLDFLTTAQNPARQAEYSAIGKDWSQIGVTAHLFALPASQFAADWATGGPRNHGDFQVSLWAFGNAPDPDSLKTLLQSQFIDRLQKTHSAVNANYSGIDDKIIDQGMEKAATTFNRKTRAKYYKQVQEELNKQAYWDMIYYRPNIVTSDFHVKGDTALAASGYFGNEWNTWNWRYVNSG